MALSEEVADIFASITESFDALKAGDETQIPTLISLVTELSQANIQQCDADEGVFRNTINEIKRRIVDNGTPTESAQMKGPIRRIVSVVKQLRAGAAPATPAAAPIVYAEVIGSLPATLCVPPPRTPADLSELRRLVQKDLERELANAAQFCTRKDFPEGIYPAADLAEHIENAMAARWLEAEATERDSYAEFYCLLLASIRTNKENPEDTLELRQKIFKGELHPVDVPKQPAAELAPESLRVKLQKYEDHFAQANKITIQLTETDEYQCRRCHKRHVGYYYLQTRGADEAMTLKLECLECHYRWSIN